MSVSHTTSSAKVTDSSTVTETELPRTATEKSVDLTLRFLNENQHLVKPMTPEDEVKLKRKLYLWVVLLALVIELMLYVRTSTFRRSQYAKLFDRLTSPPCRMHRS